ncbi:hypothetical protein ABK040_014216 [Willaertia magna]
MNVQEMFDSVTLSLIHFLESHEGVKNVQLFETKPATLSQIIQWENNHGNLTLPSELRSFLLYSNGFLLKWKIVLGGEKEIQLGYMYIHSLEKLVEVKVRSENNTVEQDTNSPFHTVFELSNSSPQSGGRVCLVYKENPISPTAATEIWYQDLAMNWWFVSKTFVEYFRLMVLHLGLPHWQMIFTDAGLPSITKQWIRFLSPQRLSIDLRRICVDNEQFMLDEKDNSDNDSMFGELVSRIKEMKRSKMKKKVKPKNTKIDLKKVDVIASKLKKKK